MSFSLSPASVMFSTFQKLPYVTQENARFPVTGPGKPRLVQLFLKLLLFNFRFDYS